MLKPVAFILSLMIVVLGVIPCSDANLDQETAEVTYSFQHAEAGHNMHLDFCTPFCSCQCCHTHISSLELFNLADLANYHINSPNNSYQLTEGISVPILHPPRHIS